MNYQLMNLQKMSLAASQVYPNGHPVRVKISAEIARVRAAGEEAYLRPVKLTPARRK